MFTNLTGELLDLSAAEVGTRRVRLAMNLEACCCCSCCTCGITC
jgi:hypothetical protein